MPIGRCPGQDNRNWKSEDVTETSCPHCGNAMEFWKTEARRRCVHCGKHVLNPHLDLGCAKWCKQAADCMGIVPGGSKTDSLCDSLIAEMKKVFGADQKRITHALEVLTYAERILPSEVADPLVVKAAAVLHDIGIQQAERAHQSNAGRYQEIEGPPIARAILGHFDIDALRVEHILRIIASHHSAGDIDTTEFRILWDADRLANIEEEYHGKDEADAERYLQKAFRTGTGRTLAAMLLLEEQPKGPGDGFLK